MKKHFLNLLWIFLCTLLLCGCSCQHEWADATCTAAKTCIKCAETEGDAVGHSWKDADCVAPKTCTRCDLAEGIPLGHLWTEATCTSPKTCGRCHTEDGSPLQHSWEGEATLFTAPICSVCGTRGELLPGYFAQNGLTINAYPDLSVDYSTNTFVRSDLETTGSFVASEVQIFEYDSTHRAKAGYEWRSVEFAISFSDNRSMLYGTNVVCARADFYQDQELKQAAKQENFTVSYNGKDHRCLAVYEKETYYFEDSSSLVLLTCYVQVPEGYDGVVLAFPHGSIAVDGMHLHEIADASTLLFRLA